MVIKEGEKIVCDGLVCSIAQALSRQADVNEIIAAVAREFDNTEIYEAWKKYFAVFNLAMLNRKLMKWRKELM